MIDPDTRHAVLERLRAARAALADPTQWRRTDFFLAADGTPVTPIAPHTESWCVKSATILTATASTDGTSIDDATTVYVLLRDLFHDAATTWMEEHPVLAHMTHSGHWAARDCYDTVISQLAQDDLDLNKAEPSSRTRGREEQRK